MTFSVDVTGIRYRVRENKDYGYLWFERAAPYRLYTTETGKRNNIIGYFKAKVK